jgi:transposase
MWEGFTSAIKELFVNAKIVYDRFHVMKNINKELNELRKRMKVHEKGLKYMLWKNKENLEEEKKEKLEEILKAHPCLGIAYEMKEEIRDIYEHSRTVNGATRKFEKWIRIAGILYQKSASMLEKHLIGVCNYFEGQGSYEGFYPNGKLKTKGTLQKGKKVGTWSLFDSNGNLTGTFVSFQENATGNPIVHLNAPVIDTIIKFIVF